MMYQDGNALCWRFDSHILRVEPWGQDALRVRATKHAAFSQQDWALSEPVSSTAKVTLGETRSTIENGRIRAELDFAGKLTFFRGETKLLEEYVRQRDLKTDYTSALNIEARELKGLSGGDFKLTARFEPNEGEKIYGMGQYQQEIFDLKGTTLELAHRNSQASIPFMLSSLGYGFLWNNPAIGEVNFSSNMTIWRAHSTKELDYWITAGENPDQIMQSYSAVTGRVPMMPDFATGFWQSKNRYWTQDELLSVAREYKRRGLPLSVIVVDYYHWEHHGDWNFDFKYWPDPAAMAKELHEMGVKLMVSIWPTVGNDSVNFAELKENGLLIRTERGVPVAMQTLGDVLFFDATNPEARDFVWQTAKRNYYDKGVDLFWLDEAEPEYSVYDYDNFRYHQGPNLQVGNIYPTMYSKAFFDGMKEAGEENIVNLVRCAWAGSQKYGALVWSGDVDSSFRALREQVVAGLHMGLSGIPWWTTDIGGYQGEDSRTREFRECLMRWFAFGTFCPVQRIHGTRAPHKTPLSNEGGGKQNSGADNEVWSYGEEAEQVMTKFLWLREAIRPYVTGLMQEAHEHGRPLMRTMFYEFPGDSRCWSIKDQYMFGRDVLVAPVMELDLRKRSVYLPAGETWIDANTMRTFEGGQVVECDAPLSTIPVFVRQDNRELAALLNSHLAK